MKIIGTLLVFIVAIAPYSYNGYKLTNCDFKSDYKCEVVHGIGVAIPPAAFVTVWFGDDSKE